MSIVFCQTAGILIGKENKMNDVLPIAERLQILKQCEKDSGSKCGVIIVPNYAKISHHAWGGNVIIPVFQIRDLPALDYCKNRPMCLWFNDPTLENNLLKNKRFLHAKVVRHTLDLFHYMDKDNASDVFDIVDSAFDASGNFLEINKLNESFCFLMSPNDNSKEVAYFSNRWNFDLMKLNSIKTAHDGYSEWLESGDLKFLVKNIKVCRPDEVKRVENGILLVPARGTINKSKYIISQVHTSKNSFVSYKELKKMMRTFFETKQERNDFIDYIKRENALIFLPKSKIVTLPSSKLTSGMGSHLENEAAIIHRAHKILGIDFPSKTLEWAYKVIDGISDRKQSAKDAVEYEKKAIRYQIELEMKEKLKEERKKHIQRKNDAFEKENMKLMARRIAQNAERNRLNMQRTYSNRMKSKMKKSS